MFAKHAAEPQVESQGAKSIPIGYLTSDIQNMLDTVLGTSLCGWWICMHPVGGLKSSDDSSDCFWLAAQNSPEVCSSDLRINMRSRLGSLVLHGSGREFENVKGSFSGDAATETLLFPLWYRNGPAGICALALKYSHPVLRDAAVLHRLSTDICYLAQRCQISLAIQRSYGNELALLGTSAALRLQDIFVERAAPTHLPALILGEPGCEKEYLGYALHVASDRYARPFESIECIALEEMGVDFFRTALARLSGGSLFLQSVDALSLPTQIALAKVVTEMLVRCDVRLIASATNDLHNIDRRKQFYTPLLRHLDFLSTVIPPLRDRAGDISLLSHNFLSRYRPEDGAEITEEVLQMFSNYSWPENVEQLRRVVARMAVLGASHRIGMDDLTSFAPEVVDGSSQKPISISKAFDQNGFHQSQIALSLLPAMGATDSPGHQIVVAHHPGIRKAVDYISKFYNSGLTLRMVAQHACLSSSHLCFLLKKDTGMSFKTILVMARIEKAKELLALRPDLRITDVSQEVGFGELTHFERMFKRVVGCSPKQYRRRIASKAYKAHAS